MSQATIRDVAAPGRTAPHLVTELPGPQARAHIAFDERFTSPCLPRAYPIVPVRGAGRVDRGHRRQPLPRLLRRHRRQRRPATAHPRVVAAIRRQAGGAPPLQRLGLLPPDLRATSRSELERIAPMRGPTRVFLGNSGAEVVEAAIKLARYAHRPASTSSPSCGAFHGRTYGAVSLTASKAKYHARFGPLLPGRLPRAVRERRPRRAGAARLPAARARRTRSRRSSSSRSRARAASSSPTTPSCRACAGSATSTASCSWPTRSSPGWAGPGRCGPIEHWGVEPDILLTAKGLASGMPIGALIAKEHLMTWGPGAHGSTFGGNPVALRRRDRDDRTSSRRA